MVVARVALAGLLALIANHAIAQTPATDQVTPSQLRGTAWQLVKFQGGDGKTLTPDDRAKYTIEFGDGGQLTARVDCNRGRGTWKVTGSSQLALGPLALTRARCPEGSLHDQIVKQWGFVRSFLIKDHHLFLSLMADGGLYEFEPMGLEGKRWTVTELAGKPILLKEQARIPYLEFQADGRVTGSDGCNRMTGTYVLKGDAITFGKIAGTMMACIDGVADIEREFRDALMGSRRVRRAGDRLELLDAAGVGLVLLEVIAAKEK